MLAASESMPVTSGIFGEANCQEAVAGADVKSRARGRRRGGQRDVVIVRVVVPSVRSFRTRTTVTCAGGAETGRLRCVAARSSPRSAGLERGRGCLLSRGAVLREAFGP